MTMFDSKEWIEAIDPPQFKAPNGQIFTGKLIGTDKWLRLQYHMRVLRASGEGIDPKLFNRAMDELVRATFPKKWYQIFRKDACWWIKRLPPIARMKAIKGFMESQALAIGMKMPPMPGIDKPVESNADSPTVG